MLPMVVLPQKQVHTVQLLHFLCNKFEDNILVKCLFSFEKYKTNQSTYNLSLQLERDISIQDTLHSSRSCLKNMGLRYTRILKVDYYTAYYYNQHVK